MDEKTLSSIVEAQWGEARSQVVPIPGAGYLAQVCTKAHEHFVKVGAPSAEKAAGMAAAAVLAPELWALVETAREAVHTRDEADLAHARDGPWEALDLKVEAAGYADMAFRAALARLPEEVRT